MEVPHQLLGPHVVQDPLCVLAVMATLHDGQQQLGGVVLGRNQTTMREGGRRRRWRRWCTNGWRWRCMSGWRRVAWTSRGKTQKNNSEHKISPKPLWSCVGQRQQAETGGPGGNALCRCLLWLPCSTALAAVINDPSLRGCLFYRCQRCPGCLERRLRPGRSTTHG